MQSYTYKSHEISKFLGSVLNLDVIQTNIWFRANLVNIRFVVAIFKMLANHNNKNVMSAFVLKYFCVFFWLTDADK